MLTGSLLAAWLGILTSISPCPLASNIAALSYVAKQSGARGAAAAGVLYALGRSLSYALLALLVVKALISTPRVSLFLQGVVTELLGPLFVLIGMLLLGLLSLPFGGFDLGGRKAAKKLEGKGLAGALALGMLLALAFCPVSAAIYFGSLVPLSVQHNSAVLLPALYGLGTALPVLVFAVIIAFSTGSIARAFKLASAVERWGTRTTGVLFIVLGIYLSLVHVFEVL